MVKARISAEEWDKIKKDTGIVESDGEAHHVHDEEPEPVATPTKQYSQVGQMQAAKGGKPAGAVTEWKSHEGYDAQAESFAGKHPTLAKAVDIGKKVAGKVGEFVEEEMIHHGAAERKKPTKEEQEEKKKKKQKELSSIEKKLQEGLTGDGEEDKDKDEESDKKSKKSKVLAGSYKSAYESQSGIFGSRGYEPAFKSQLRMGSYQPAYKAQMRKPSEEAESEITQLPTTKKRTKSAVEELMPNAPAVPSQPQRSPEPEPDRFNTQNWQSLGFPNTLPQSARGSLFRPAQQQPVVPMVRQPYQPHPTVQTLIPQKRAPMSGPMPRIGLNINATPQIMKPKTTITPPRAPSRVVQKTAPSPAPMTFMGVTLGEKKKQEPNKPITRMGEGYKHVPLVVMNGIYPAASYNPNKDSITKKSVIPKIRATVSPNDFTMFGMRVKNKKN
ncbi:MAG: hypothetical protein WCX79_01005 [Candidatus Paceibacterota bacterium]|jgi:hypothetical protein